MDHGGPLCHCQWTHTALLKTLFRIQSPPPPPHSLHSPAIKLVRKVLDELKGDLEGKEDSDLLEAEVVLRTKLFYFGRYRMLLVF